MVFWADISINISVVTNKWIRPLQVYNYFNNYLAILMKADKNQISSVQSSIAKNILRQMQLNLISTILICKFDLCKK